MARTRSIKPGFFMNEELAELTCEARLLFIGLWTVADREGRLEDRPRKIKAAVFPYDECDVDELLAQLAHKGFLRRYAAKGGRFIHITNFAKHQKPHPREAPSDIPVFAEDDRVPGNHEKDGASHEGDGARREKDGTSREKDGASHEEDGISHEKDGPSHKKVGPGRGIPDSGQCGAGSSREKNGPVHARAFLTKDIRKEKPEDERKEESGQAAGKADLDWPVRPAKVEVVPGLRIVFEYWKQKMGHADAKLTSEREMKIRGRLGEGYDVDQLKAAVDGCRGSAFHQGDNDRGHRYDDITLICRSGSKVEQFIEMTKEAGDERRQSRRRSNVKKIMDGLELVRARIAQSGDPGDDNQQGESRMLAAGAGAG